MGSPRLLPAAMDGLRLLLSEAQPLALRHTSNQSPNRAPLVAARPVGDEGSTHILDRGRNPPQDRTPLQPISLTAMNQEELKKQMAEMIDQIRADNGDLIASMPCDATTPGQEALKAKYGSPRAFAQACNNRIGEISCLEAHTLIAEYKATWDASGNLDSMLNKNQDLDLDSCVEETCDTCQGHGEIICYCEADPAHCPHCGSDGYRSCPRCGSLGHYHD